MDDVLFVLYKDIYMKTLAEEPNNYEKLHELLDRIDRRIDAVAEHRLKSRR